MASNESPKETLILETIVTGEEGVGLVRILVD